MASRRRLEKRFAFASGAVHHHRRRPVLEVLEGRALLATFTVNGLGDARTGSGDAGDLRYCIDQANADDQTNQIVFDLTVFSTPQTITLSGGQLELEDTGGTQTITGPAAGVTISGGGNSRVFQVDPGVTASISGLTISGGSISSGNGGGLANGGTVTLTDCTLSGNTAPNGGGVYNYGTANLTGCALSGNTAYVREAYGGGFGNGGGVDNDGSANLTLTDCVLSGNSANYSGCVSNNGTADLTLTGCTVSGNSASGVSNAYKCSLTLTDCTISDNEGVGLENGGMANLTDCTLSSNENSPDSAGGGLSNRGTANLTDCTVSGNSGGGGGGVFNSGTANLTDCTVSGNTALPYYIYEESFGGYGGGVFDTGTANLTLTECTVSGNAASAAGAGGLNDGASGTVTLTDTIVAGNTNPSGASDIGGSEAGNVTGTYNLVGSGGSGGLTNGVNGNIVLTSLNNLGLASLGNNGGPTQTMALLPGSAAIGAGVIADYPGTNTPITTDQRGEPLDSPNPDIGAFQTQGSSTLIALTFSGISSQSTTYGTSSVTISGTLANGSQTPVGESVSVTLDGVEQPATIQSGGAFSTTFTYDSAGLAVSDSPYTVNYAYQSDGKFASASTTSTLTVNPATLTIAASPETKVYGTADPALAYTATGFEHADTAATVLTGALARAEEGILAGEQAGAYAITQGTLAADSNYTITFTGSTLTITPASLTVTATPQTKVYGTNDPAVTVMTTGLVDTTVDGVTIDDTAASVLTGNLARAQAGTTAGEQTGSYAITQGTLAADSDYTIKFTGGTLTITPASLSVTANSQTKLYGTPDPALTVTPMGLVDATIEGVAINDTAATVLSGSLARAQAGTVAGEQVGSYSINQGTLAADSNYKMNFTGSTLTITPAALTVTANPQTKVYGTSDPTLTDTVTGLVDATVDGVTIDDTAANMLSGSLVRAQAGSLSGEQAGSYAITQGTLAANSNYTMQFTGSTLTITPAPLSVTANPQTKDYGDADPILTDTVTGLVDTTVDGVPIADTAATVLSGALARAPGETVAGSPYAITQGTLLANSDYTIQFTPSTLSITPASPTVSVKAPGGVYTGSPIAAQATVTGVTGTAAARIEGVAPTLTYYVGSGTSGKDLGAAAPSAAGIYTVVASFPGSADYAPNQSAATTFTVRQSATAIVLVPHAVLTGKKTLSAVSLTAEIKPVAPGGGVPTGEVIFELVKKPGKKTQMQTLGAAALKGGVATLSFKPTAVLNQALTIVYSGNPDFLATTMNPPKLTKAGIEDSAER